MAKTLPGGHQKTLVADIRLAGITSHGAQNTQSRRRSAINARNVRLIDLTHRLSQREALARNGPSRPI